MSEDEHTDSNGADGDGPDENEATEDNVIEEGAAAEPFDSDAWFQKLLELNPWAKPYFEQIEALKAQGLWQGKLDQEGWGFEEENWNKETKTIQKGFAQARLQKALERWRGLETNNNGEESWNNWANGMLMLKKRLEKAELWTHSDWALGDNVSVEQKLYAPIAAIDFSNLCFLKEVNFSHFIFPGNVWFKASKFTTSAEFSHAVFENYVDFNQVIFENDSWFLGTEFYEDANFRSTRFNGEAGFIGAEFNREVSFNGAVFELAAAFEETKFSGNTSFNNTEFNWRAWFTRVVFTEEAKFENTMFNAAAHFESTIFKKRAQFKNSKFGEGTASTSQSSASFLSTEFAQSTDFTFCQINAPINFSHSRFGGPVTFQSCYSKVSFSLADCMFKQVPDITEASFHQPPRLDNVFIEDPVQNIFSGGKLTFVQSKDPRPQNFWVRLLGLASMKLTADKEDEAKYRALRRQAIEGKDHIQELEFHAQEIRCRRFWLDKPWGRYAYDVLEQRLDEKPEWQIALHNRPRGEPEWRSVTKEEYEAFKIGEEKNDPEHPDWVTLRRLDKRRRPSGAGRFWFGWLYGGFSNFGRSMAIPFSWWLGLIFCFAVIYLSYQAEPAQNPARDIARLSSPLFSCPAKADQPAVRMRRWPAICRRLEQRARSSLQCVDQRSGTTPITEALALSIKNAFVFIYWDRAQAARRTYGCLYGLHYDKSGKSFTNVPAFVSFFSLLQMVLSAILIFLFLLALRNLLKLK